MVARSSTRLATRPRPASLSTGSMTIGGRLHSPVLRAGSLGSCRLAGLLNPFLTLNNADVLKSRGSGASSIQSHFSTPLVLAHSHLKQGPQRTRTATTVPLTVCSSLSKRLSLAKLLLNNSLAIRSPAGRKSSYACFESEPARKWPHSVSEPVPNPGIHFPKEDSNHRRR